MSLTDRDRHGHAIGADHPDVPTPMRVDAARAVVLHSVRDLGSWPCHAADPTGPEHTGVVVIEWRSRFGRYRRVGSCGADLHAYLAGVDGDDVVVWTRGGSAELTELPPLGHRPGAPTLVVADPVAAPVRPAVGGNPLWQDSARLYAIPGGRS